MGIKRLAPELGVSYTYLSKLENNELTSSEKFVQRAARYFKTDRNQITLAKIMVEQDRFDEAERLYSKLREAF